MSEDYVGGVWIDGEFYAESKRESRVQTKEEAVYGVFGNFEENRRSKRVQSASLAKPVSFVGGDLYKSADVANKYKGDERGGEDGRQAMEEDEEGADASQDEANMTRLELRRKRRVEKERREREEAARSGKDKQKKKPKKVKTDKEFASFQKLSGGLGMRMLAKMGYKGGALGRHGNGIVNPVKTKQRPQMMGLGYGGFKERANMTQAELDGGDDDNDAEERAAQERRRKKALRRPAVGKNWKRDGKKKTKRVYKSVDEIGKEHEDEEEQRAAPELVIDMRGPHVRVTSLNKVGELVEDGGGMGGEGDGWTPTGSASTLPELRWNMDALVEHTESEVRKIITAKKTAEKTVDKLEDQREKLAQRVEKQKSEAANLESLLDVIKKAREDSEETASVSTWPLSAAQILVDAFSSLCEKHELEYKLHGVARVAYALGAEALKKALKRWKPFQARSSPNTITTAELVPLLRQWRRVLEGGGAGHSAKLYQELLEDCVMSSIQIALSTTPVRQFEGPISLLDNIRPALPRSMYVFVLTEVVSPRLKSELSQWQPTKDPLPVHKWVHPWLDILPPHLLEPMFTTVRSKLGQALRQWKAKDKSALILIKPWTNLWKQTGDLWEFLARFILPKLRALATKISVNPKKEDPSLFLAIVAWNDVLPNHALDSMLLNDFFPKWILALKSWLEAPAENDQKKKEKFKEVAKWYKGWKGLFPPALLKHRVVKTHLKRGLELMGAAVSGKSLDPILKTLAGEFQQQKAALREQAALAGEGSAAAASAAAISSRRKAEAKQLRAAAARAAGGAAPGTSFKEALERFAAKVGVEFLPNPKKGYRDGSPVYLFGRCNIYIKGQVIYVHVAAAGGGGAWKPVAIDDLISMAKK